MRLLTLFLLAISLCFFVCEQTALAEYVFSPSDFNVYSTILGEWFNPAQGKAMVLRGRTAIGCPIENLDEELAFVASRLVGLRSETINDFLAKNIQSYPLDPDYFLGGSIAHMVIAPQELAEIFRYEDGWSKFYQRYPDARGILTFSRVGFNVYGSQALVYVGSQWSDFSGTGVYVLLTQDSEGVWNIQQQVPVWHSWLPQEQDHFFPQEPTESQPIL